MIADPQGRVPALDESEDPRAPGDEATVSHTARSSRFAALPGRTDYAARTGILAVLLVAMGAYFSVRNGGFLAGSNVKTILTDSAVLAIVSLGQLMTIVSGGFDLSISGVAPLGGVVYAELLNHNMSTAGAIALTLAVGLAAGVGNGLVISYLRINPLITTLATLSITGGVALSISGGLDVTFNRPVSTLSEAGALGISNAVWIAALMSVLVLLLLRFTVLGRYLYATGGNREAARLSGIRVGIVTTSIYALSGALAALAGAILASQLLTGSGTSGSDLALESIAAVILGGAALTGGSGGVIGTLLGVLILGALENGMTILGVASFYQTIAQGAALLVAVGLSQIRGLGDWRARINRTPQGEGPRT